MENASKALLIAGAILLSILIIAVGIAVFTSAKGTIDDAMNSMSEQEIIAFNSKFLSYQGESVSGTQVKALIAALVNNFATNQEEIEKIPEYHFIGQMVNGSARGYTCDIINNKSNYIRNLNLFQKNYLITKHKFKVTMEFGKSGIIKKINATDITKR